MEDIKFEPMKTVGHIQTTNIILSKMYGIPRLKECQELYEIMELNEDTISPTFLCRLCANSGNDMVHIFDANELHDNSITQKIKDCSLPIVVTETDNLTKYACRICLGKLELCYQFHKTVAEAENQLLAYIGETKSSKIIAETEEYRKTLSVYDGGQRSARKLASNGMIIKPPAQICHTKNQCSKISKNRSREDECKKEDLNMDFLNAGQTSDIEQNNIRQLGKELRSEKQVNRSDSGFYSPPITRSQSQTECDKKKKKKKKKMKKKTRKYTKNDVIPICENKHKDKRPKLDESMKTIDLQEKSRSEKEEDIPDFVFYSPPITRSRSHTVSDSVKKPESKNDSSDDDNSVWEEKFEDQNPKLNIPINRIHLEKESESVNKEHISDCKLYTLPITRSKSPTVCNSGKITEGSKDNSDDDILFWEAKFKDQIFSDQSVAYDEITCRICEASFQTAEKCYLHGSVHAWTNYYPCCVCNKTFDTENEWKKHSPEHKDIRLEFENRDIIMHDCNECGKKFVSEARLKFHKLFHKSSAEIIPTKRGSPSLQQLCWTLNQRLLAETRKDPLSSNRILHNCEECDTVMESKKSLEEHVLTSHDKQQQEFCSNACGNQFRTEEQLNDHQRNRDRTFECTLGKRRFDSNDTVKVHGEVPRRQSLTENKFSCAHCGTTCTRKGHLIIHLRSHSKERIYSCDICTKKFATKEARNNHSRKHTGVTRSFKCSKCDKNFVWEDSLKQHEISHSLNNTVPWKCTRCDKSFSTTTESRHDYLNVLHNDRPYNCDPCKISFKEQRIVRRNEKTIRHEKIDRIKYKNFCKMESIFRNVS